MFVLCNPNTLGLLQLQGEHPEIFARTGVGCWKSGYRLTKALISLKRGKIGPRLLLRSNKEVIYALSIGAKINDFGWPWSVIMHSDLIKTRASFGAHCENLNEDRANVAQWLYFLPIYWFVPIFEGFIGDRASNDSGVIETWICTAFDTTSSAS